MSSNWGIARPLHLIALTPGRSPDPVATPCPGAAVAEIAVASASAVVFTANLTPIPRRSTSLLLSPRMGMSVTFLPYFACAGRLLRRELLTPVFTSSPPHSHPAAPFSPLPDSWHATPPPAATLPSLLHSAPVLSARSPANKTPPVRPDSAPPPPSAEEQRCSCRSVSILPCPSNTLPPRSRASLCGRVPVTAGSFGILRSARTVRRENRSRSRPRHPDQELCAAPFRLPRDAAS